VNYLDFIISKTVRKHLKEIGYQPSALETAWLVWQCKNATLQQKHDAWHEIIATTEDCPIPAGDWCGTSPSLHRHLERHMMVEARMMKDFYNNDASRGIYSYALCFEEKDFDWQDDDCLFSDFEACWQAATEKFDLGVRAVRVQKRILNEAISSVWVDFLPSREVVAVSTENDAAFADNLIDEWLDGLHLPIPTPFEKGDILIPAARKAGPHSSFEEICVFDGFKDGCAYGYFTNENGDLCYEQIIHPLNHELFQGTLAAGEKVLYLFSRYLRGEISLMEFLDAKKLSF